MSLKSNRFIFKSLTVKQILSRQVVEHVSKFQGTGQVLVIHEKVTWVYSKYLGRDPGRVIFKNKI